MAHDNRDDALAVPDSHFYFLPAYLGFCRIWADKKEKSICFFNSFFDLLPPVHGGRDAFPVDPEVQVAFLEFGGEAFCECDVFAGIGNEDFGHPNSSPAYMVSL
jgi:hypothetical protein